MSQVQDQEHDRGRTHDAHREGVLALEHRRKHEHRDDDEGEAETEERAETTEAGHQDHHERVGGGE